MTNESPSSAEIQELLEEFKHRCNPNVQTGNEDLFLEKEGGKILAYIRQLEQEHRELRQTLRKVRTYRNNPYTVDDICGVTLNSIPPRP